jgi:hypothetical protein
VDADTLAALLHRTFQGREDYYSKQRDEPPFAYNPVNKPFTLDVARSHVQGGLTVGLYPIRADLKTVLFSALDFDVSPEAFPTMDAARHAVRVASQVLTRMALPHLLEHSGNKGYHLWVTFAVPIPARTARQFLRAVVGQIEEETGKVVVELYPKQDEIPPGGVGNLIKLPWGIHKKSGKRAFLLDDDLEYLTKEGQLSALEHHVPLTEGQVMDFIAEYGTEEGAKPARQIDLNGSKDSTFGKGSVPCTSRMLLSPAGEGGRNHRLYQLAVRFYREGKPDGQALSQLMGFNIRMCKPPVPEEEVRNVLRSAYKGATRSLQCDQLSAFCAGAECPIYRSTHGLPPPDVEKAVGEFTPTLFTNLVKIDTDPPIWRAKVEGVPVEFMGAEIGKYQAVYDKILTKLTKVHDLPTKPKQSKQAAWTEYLKPLLETCEVESAPEDASERGRLREIILDWLEGQAVPGGGLENLELNKQPICHPETPHIVRFRLDGVMKWIKRHQLGGWDAHEIYAVLRDMGFPNKPAKIEGKSIRVYEADLSAPESEGA